MAGRKLLYMLRGPLPAGQVDSLLPEGTPSLFEDDISVVLLDDANVDNRSFPGRVDSPETVFLTVHSTHKSYSHSYDY